MLAIHRVTKWCLILTAMACAACAANPQPQTVPSDRGVVTIRVSNQSAAFADVYFVYDNGDNLPIGFVPPVSTKTFVAPLTAVGWPGHFYVRRLGDDVANMIKSEVNPMRHAGRSLDLKIGQAPAFDYLR